MSDRRTVRLLLGFSAVACFMLAGPRVVPAQERTLSWDALEVTASLGDDGVLDVIEQQTILFNGNWNGAERTFNLRPRQRLELVGIDRLDPQRNALIPLTEDRDIDDVDEYAFADTNTLRWRSRLTTDPPFSATRITYTIHYRLSGILQKDGEQYVLDHDFAFPDREGAIQAFSLDLALGAAWQPLSAVERRYTAGPIPPGNSFVLTIPMQYTGAGTPSANDGSRPREVVAAIWAIGGVLTLSILALVAREHWLGRFAPIRVENVNADWIRQNILAHPAEVVGAAWDQDVGSSEVVALIARLVGEGKLASHVSPSSLLTLDLKADRSDFTGYERTLIDALFFEQRSRTSTDALRKHYEKTGFDPAKTIGAELEETVKQIVPRGDKVKPWPWPTIAFFLIGAGCLWKEMTIRGEVGLGPFVTGVLALFVGAIGQVPGLAFRQRMDWGYKDLLSGLLVPVLAAAGTIWFLWSRVGSGALEWSVWMIGAMTALTIWVVYAAINGLKSRSHSQAVAFRKVLTAGRVYFQRELEKDQPALSDAWYPWIVAFDLTKEVDQWTVRTSSGGGSSSRWRSSPTTYSTSSSSSGSSSEPAWTGAGGGRSGGAGGGASWATAVSGMAAGVSPPSSSSSGGGGGRSSGSSSGGSSGGGGGGGW